MLYEIYSQFIKENWILYLITLITLLALPLQKVSMPHYYGKIIDSLKVGDMSKSFNLFITILGIWIFIQAMGLIGAYVKNTIWPRLNTYVRQKFLDLIIDRYNCHYQSLKTGEIQNKLQNLPWILDDIYTEIENLILNHSIIIIASFIYLSRHHIYLGIVYIISIIVVFIMGLLYVYNCQDIVKNIYKSFDNYFEEVDDTLNNLLSIYTNKKIGEEKRRINQFSNDAETFFKNAHSFDFKYKVVFSIVNVFIFIGLNYTAYNLYQQKIIDSSALVSVFIINFTLLGDLLQIYNNARNFVELKGKVELINEFLNELPPASLTKTSTLGIMPQIDIVMKNIKYQADAKDPKTLIYDDFNIHIPANQDIVVIGHIGSGKSTFAKLIVGLITHQKGEIIINGANRDDINIDDVRNNIIYVPQHPQLFNRTLWDNITYSLSDAEKQDMNPESVYKLLEDLGLGDLAKKFQHKMYKPVGKGGGTLSGGQRQIIWLLRCLFKKSPVVILDEPTSSLDPESKAQIINMINYIRTQKTVIIITHDKELMTLGDRLIEFKNGKLIKDIPTKYL